MATFFMFGKYSLDSLGKISAQRTETARQVVEQLGGRIKDIYALLGQYDLILIVELPNMAKAMETSVALQRATGISFSTVAAVPIEDFDQMAGQG